MLSNKSSLLTLIDSGASKSVISSATITNNTYLASLVPEKCTTVEFMVGNGQGLSSNYVFTFLVEKQGNTFKLTSHIVETLGGIDLIIGAVFKRIRAFLRLPNK
jgi:hypothetical protein